MLTHLTQQLAADEQRRKSMQTAATVEIENVGPIERLMIPLPQSGVVVLRGRNGCGKSHALAAVDQLASGRGKVPCRDGAAKGTIAGFGARLTIGRSTRRTGEAEVATLEGRLDISQLVQPPVKEEESADRIRIKALVQLSGAEADPQEFDRILPQGTTLGQLVAPNEYSDDPVVLAGRVKRALEAEARRAERIAAEARARAEAIASQCGEAPAEPCDLHEAEAELQRALLWQKELQTRAVEAAKAAEKARKAADAIESLKASAAAGDDPEALAAEEAELNESIAKLERALAVATERRAQVRRRLSEARTIRAHIEQLQSLSEDDAAYLKDIICGLAMLRLTACRVSTIGTEVWQELRRDLRERLEEIERGDRVFATDDAISAGLPKADGPKAVDYQRMNLLVDRCRGYYPARSDDLPAGR